MAGVNNAVLVRGDVPRTSTAASQVINGFIRTAAVVAVSFPRITFGAPGPLPVPVVPSGRVIVGIPPAPAVVGVAYPRVTMGTSPAVTPSTPVLVSRVWSSFTPPASAPASTPAIMVGQSPTTLPVPLALTSRVWSSFTPLPAAPFSTVAITIGASPSVPPVRPLPSGFVGGVVLSPTASPVTATVIVGRLAVVSPLAPSTVLVGSVGRLTISAVTVTQSPAPVTPLAPAQLPQSRVWSGFTPIVPFTSPSIIISPDWGRPLPSTIRPPFSVVWSPNLSTVFAPKLVPCAENMLTIDVQVKNTFQSC